MLALSIRQPYAEEILRGIKKVEYRNGPTKIIGKRFYIYAARKVPDQADTAERFRKLGAEVGGLPTGVLVGTAKFSKCARCEGGGADTSDARSAVTSIAPPSPPPPPTFPGCRDR